MADSGGQMDDWSELADDELISKLVPDPGNPNVNVLTGVLLGRGRDDKWLRIYTTLQLNQFVEVPVDSILGVKRFPMGQIAVWIPADVDVQVTTTRTLSGDFLKGSIQATHGGAMGGVGGLISAMVGTGGGGTSWGGCVTDFASPDCPIPTTSSPPLCNPSPTGCRC
jgi:uncharacterized membrane protein